MGRPARTAQNIQKFRDEACQTALQLFAHQPEVSLRQLASAMGCSPATPYRYFEDKQELFIAVRALCFTRFTAYMKQRLDAQDDPLERVCDLALAYADYADLQPAQFRLMFQLGQPQPEHYPWAHEASVGAWKIVEDTVARAINAGVLTGDVTDLAHLIWAATHGVVSLSQAHRLSMGRSADDLLLPMIKTLCRAHGAPHA